MHSIPNFLRLKDVVKRTGLSKSTIYDLINKGEFPKQIPITLRCVGWSEDEIHTWLVKKLESRLKA